VCDDLIYPIQKLQINKMKKYLMMLLLCAMTCVSVFGCEICGCGNSNFQIGLLPSFSKGFLGVRYSMSQFSSIVKEDQTQYSHDYFKITELWGGYNFNKLQVMAFVPHIISRKESDDGVTASQGIGDVMLLLNYKLFSSTAISNNESTTIRHELYAGGGIKLPTGVNRVNVDDPGFNIGDFNSQVGTGSVDYLLNLTHNMMWNRSGIVTNVAYRINSSNSQDYRFGNRAYLNGSYYYTITAGVMKIKPSAGVNYQANAVNTFSGLNVVDSNGYNLNATLGVNVLYNKIGVSAMAFLPVAQEIYAGQTELKSRVMLGLTYSF